MKLFILFIVSIVLVQAQTINFSQDTIIYNNQFNNRVFPAYNSQGKISLTYTGQLGTNSATREIYYAEEQNDGSFTITNITNNSVDDNYATTNIDQNDKVHIVFEGRDASNNFQIKYTNNVSGTFFTPIWLTTGGLNKAVPYSKVGRDSVVHFVYWTYVTGDDYCYYRNYDLKTSTLSPEIPITLGESGSDFEATLDIDTNNFVHIVIKPGSIWGAPLKYFNNSTGSFVEVPIPGLTNNIVNPQIKIDKNNVIHILFRDESAGNRINYINNASGNFSIPIAITPSGQRPAFYQNIGMDADNNLYFLYASNYAPKGYYLLSRLNGVWQDTLFVYDFPTGYVTRNNSAIIAKGSGDIAMFYAPGAVRSGDVICDIFMKRGNIYSVLPVELTSFTGIINTKGVELKWSTATELNNNGFEVHRSDNNSNWQMISFIKGNGTTNEAIGYTYQDNLSETGKYFYKIVQIDFDGTRTESNIVEVDFVNSDNIVLSYGLKNNYPNPFNPTTTIEYSIPERQNVRLIIYNSIGKEIAVLVNETKEAGNYKVNFNADVNLPSGVYFYKIQAGSFSEVKKLMLLK